MTDEPNVIEKFRCPQCHGQRLEEVLVNTTVTSPVESVEEDGYIDYGEQENGDGVVDRYQCSHCGWVVPNVQSPATLYLWLADLPELKVEVKTRPIEFLLALADGRWVTEVLDVPLPFPDNFSQTEHLINYAEGVFLDGARTPEVVAVAIYNTREDDDREPG
jgi:hypothetical protein